MHAKTQMYSNGMDVTNTVILRKAGLAQEVTSMAQTLATNIMETVVELALKNVMMQTSLTEMDAAHLCLLKQVTNELVAT